MFLEIGSCVTLIIISVRQVTKLPLNWQLPINCKMQTTFKIKYFIFCFFVFAYKKKIIPQSYKSVCQIWHALLNSYFYNTFIYYVPIFT